MAWNKIHGEHVMCGIVRWSCLNAYFVLGDIVFKVTWLPCPSRTSKCLLLKETPPKIKFLKKERNSLNKKEVIQAFLALPCKSMVWRVYCSLPTIFLPWRCRTLVKQTLWHSLHNLFLQLRYGIINNIWPSFS